MWEWNNANDISEWPKERVGSSLFGAKNKGNVGNIEMAKMS